MLVMENSSALSFFSSLPEDTFIVGKLFWTTGAMNDVFSLRVYNGFVVSIYCVRLIKLLN